MCAGIYFIPTYYLMTCFWDGLIQGLGYDEIRNVLQLSSNNTITFIERIKAHYTDLDNVVWNGNRLPTREKAEMREHIMGYDSSSAINGYDCSVCDPFLALVVQLFEITICQNFNGSRMLYSNHIRGQYQLNFHNSTTHFTFQNRV